MKRVFLLATSSAVLAGCVALPSEDDMAAKCGNDMQCRRDMIHSAEIAHQEMMSRISAAGEALSNSSSSSSFNQPAPPAASRPAGFLERQYVDGVNRICVYNSMGSEYIVTINSTSLCPLSP